MSIKSDIERNQYVVVLVKKIDQRPEHMAASFRRHPKMHPKRFISVHKWSQIPEDFFEVIRKITMKGVQVDGTAEGDYSLVLHGRGQRFGNKKTDAKYKAGCEFSYDYVRGIHSLEMKSSHPAFMRLMSQAKRYSKVPLPTKRITRLGEN